MKWRPILSEVETTTVDFRISLVNNIRGAEIPGGVLLTVMDEGFHGLTFVPNVHLEKTKESRPQIGTLWELKAGSPSENPEP